MTALQDILERHVDDGTLPGVVALAARADRVEVAAAGRLALDGEEPAARDSIFQIASITKPITAAAVLRLVDAGEVALADPVARWLPELAAPVVVRTPASPVEDVVPAVRPITVEDLLTFRAGWGYPADFSLPAVEALSAVEPGMLGRERMPPTDAWLAALAGVPLLHQPGRAWLYNTCSDVQGALVERVTGRPFDEVLAEQVLGPLGMVDTGFAVPPADLGRLATTYRPADGGGLELVDRPGPHWSARPAFASGAGGLVSTVDDWWAFGRMLLAGGTVVGGPDDGRRILSAEAVQLMTTDHLTAAQRADSGLFLEGQGWGYGGSVDIEATQEWAVPGRYGWVGGTGTSAYVTPSTGTVSVLLGQRELSGPAAPEYMRDVWRHAATF
jgi:CubicO group peptidase (beta-lactamase class C family)